MIRKTVVCVILLLGLAGTLWAPSLIGCEVDDDYNRQYTGASFAATDGPVTFPKGEAITGEVVNPTALARHGFEGVKKGDAVEATWLGGQKFRFLHTASGKSVEIIFPKDKVKLK